MTALRRILVPRFVDRANLNAQNLNAKAMLARFRAPEAEWMTAYHGDPEPEVRNAANVRLTPLGADRAWKWRLVRLYQQNADAIFYPGREWPDLAGLRWRKLTGRRIPVIGTLEALAGDEERERQLSTWAGHRVYCQRVSAKVVRRVDAILQDCDHIIAISPFLADMGARLYGPKFSVCGLGIDAEIFHAMGRDQAEPMRFVCAGNFQPGKRPEMLLELGARFPQAEFHWFGHGAEDAFNQRAQQRRLKNVKYAGPRTPAALADEFCQAHAFLMLSYAEGVPKVAQEAAACGLPVLQFGFYEAPTVVDGQNGFVIWDDEQLFARVGEWIESPSRAAAMGACGAQMAKQWSWDIQAPQWEQAVVGAIF